MPTSPHLILHPTAELSAVTVSQVPGGVTLALTSDGAVRLSPAEARAVAAALVAAAEVAE